MNGRGEPNWQPISILATIASLIDGGLSDAREHYAMLLKARPKPYVLDDATIVRTKRVNGEGLEWCEVYDRQLRRWRSERLTGAQGREVARLQGVTGELRVELARILELDRRARARNDRASAREERSRARGSSICCARIRGPDRGRVRWRRSSGRRTRGFGGW